MLPAQPNRSLIDGLAVLQSLASAGGPIGGREMARQVGLEPTRVNRLLKTLSHLGLAEQDEQRKYLPGPAIHVLAAQALSGSGLLQHASPVLDQLRGLGLVVALGMVWRTSMTYLYHAGADAPPGASLGRVGLYPAKRSGLGVAILAERTDDQIRQLYPDKAESKEVLALVRETRKAGYAVVHRADQTTAIGVGLGTQTQAAIGLAGKMANRDVPRLAGKLIDAAQAIREAA